MTLAFSPNSMITAQECTYGRNLARQFNVLGQAQLALLQRALEVCLLDGVARIALLVDQGDQPVLDLKVHLAALLNLFLEVARGLDAQLLTTVPSVSMRRINKTYSSPQRAVGAEIH